MRKGFSGCVRVLEVISNRRGWDSGRTHAYEELGTNQAGARGDSGSDQYPRGALNFQLPDLWIVTIFLDFRPQNPDRGKA